MYNIISILVLYVCVSIWIINKCASTFLCSSWLTTGPVIVRRVWRYQRGNQNPYIEEEQTTQWPKEKVQKDKQRSTKHTYKTKDQ
jgi:hypothetical protein